MIPVVERYRRYANYKVLIDVNTYTSIDEWGSEVTRYDPLTAAFASFFQKHLNEYCTCGHKLHEHSFPLKGGYDCDKELEGRIDVCQCGGFEFQFKEISSGL